MRISDLVPATSLPADFNVVREAPLPPEIPTAIHAGFSLVQLLERSVKALNRNLENMLKCPAGVAKGLEGGSAETLAQYFASAEFVEQIQSKRIRSQMWIQQTRQCAMVLTHCLATLSMEQLQPLYDGQNLILGELKRMPVPVEIADEFAAELRSSNEFFDKLLNLIDLIKNGYLAGYE
ncbi:IpaD/SipD/SspD family type III secretion system needle tip protein, partial [Pseudomonas sp. KB_15]